MIIALDPSGNFKEGLGTTGICHMDLGGRVIRVDEIHAGDSNSAEEYWNDHIEHLEKMDFSTDARLEIVMEGFRLYADKKSEQVNSQFETPQLIGVIRHWCFREDVKLKITYASEVKTRWSDDVLIRKGYIYKKGTKRYLTATDQSLNNHKTDALRHALHYYRYGRKGS
jgi:hypothetical protein